MSFVKIGIAVVNAIGILAGFGFAIAWLFRANADPSLERIAFGLSGKVALARLATSFLFQAGLFLSLYLFVPILPAVLAYWWVRIFFSGAGSILSMRRSR